MFRKLTLAVAALAVTTITSFAQYSVSGGGGPVPTGAGSGGGGNSADTLPTEYSVFPLSAPVPAGATSITSVTLQGLSHTWAGDLQVVLWDPTMTTGYNLLVRVGVIAPANCCGNGNDFLGGDYTFVKAGDPSITVPAWSATAVLPPGVYPQEYGTSYGTGWISGSAGVVNTDMAAIPVTPGIWTLIIYDGAALDIGGILGWSMAGDSGTTSTTFCAGDGTGAACPCLNNGLPGNGCGHSVSANGANLAATGTASVANDTLVLAGTNMPNSSALYFQGTGQIAAGAGSPFGDGKRCAGGSVTRLGTKTNVGGSSQYPAAGDPVIHIKGNNVAGNTRQYQIWFRNAAAFCTASTFNLSNGVELVWIP